VNKTWLVVGLVFCNADPALAQSSELSVSVGVRAWYTDWTTFSYFTDGNGNNLALTQTAAQEELVLMPIVSLRYGKFSGSISAFPSKSFSFVDGGSGKREELDVNFGYAVRPGLTVTVGYKKVEQSDGDLRYRPAGPVIGVSGYAPLGGLLSLYGSLGLGWMKTPSGDAIEFDADYRLAELGLASTPNGEVLKGRWTFTGGYRIQVLDSKDAFGSQDGRDTTQGFTVGTLFTF
jgi:hypothetical protein